MGLSIERFDTIVVGAGPAGSTSAYRLARKGASVLLLDRARFPRDKPCGGALSLRAIRLLPFSIDSVVEDVPERFDVRLRYGARFERRLDRPLAVMTQRRRLDAFLVEQAVAAGAEFRDGIRVTGVRAARDGMLVDTDGGRLSATAVIAADGVNGTTARSLGIGPRPLYGVALEGNVSYTDVDEALYRGCAVFELGIVPGGYAWVFPKGNHVNVGVLGSEREAPRLREHLGRLCRAHAVPSGKVRALRGHRLPMGMTNTAVLGRGRTAAVGDAAGLVDTFSADGIYESLLSAALAAEAVASMLAGRASGLDGYDATLKRALRTQMALSWAAKRALDRFPGAIFALVRSGPGRWAVERALRTGARHGG